MVTIDIETLDPLYCNKHDVHHRWSGEFTENGCNDKNCEYCKDKPGSITDEYCLKCEQKEGCISWNARQLKKEDSHKP